MQSLRQRLAVAPSRPWPDQPVPVALVITDLDIGGAERALVALATHLDPGRWRPKVFCLGESGPLAEVLRRAKVPCECLGVSRWNPVQAIGRLALSLRRFEPLIVQSFLFHANIASRLAGPWARSPWVVSGIRVAERQKHWHLMVDRLTTPLGTGSVCVSEGVSRFSQEVGRISPARLTVIPNGIDPTTADRAAVLPRASLGLPDDVHVALYVGRLDPQKGLPDLLDAAELVIAQRQRPDWHLVLAGDGPQNAWLSRQIADRRRLAGRVHYLGPRNDVPSLLRSVDLLVHPSLWEGMPNVVLEAMAARLPVVATAVEGTEDLVVPNETGWLVPPRDAVALSRALIEAADSPDLCRRYGDAGRRRVEKKFSLVATVMAYEKLWATVLGLDVAGFAKRGEDA